MTPARARARRSTWRTAFAVIGWPSRPRKSASVAHEERGRSHAIQIRDEHRAHRHRERPRALASRLAAHAQLAAIDIETVDRGRLELRQCREPLQREAVMVASLTRILGRSGASFLNVFVARSLICDSSLSRKRP